MLVGLSELSPHTFLKGRQKYLVTYQKGKGLDKPFVISTEARRNGARSGEISIRISTLLTNTIRAAHSGQSIFL